MSKACCSTSNDEHKDTHDHNHKGHDHEHNNMF